MGVTHYITGFEAKYSAAKATGLGEMPQPYLMFMVIDNCMISEQDRKFVMAGVDLQQKTKLYEQAKSSLSKFMAGPGTETEASGIALKDSETFYAGGNNWNTVPQYQPKHPMQGGG